MRAMTRLMLPKDLRLDRGLDGVGVAEGDVDHVLLGHAEQESALEPAGRRHRQRSVGLAVEGALRADELRLLLGELDALAQLHRRFDGFRAGDSKEADVQRIGQALRDVVGERRLDLVGRHADAVDELALVALALRLDDARMVVAEAHDADAGGEIEQRPPVVEPDLDALPAPDVQLVEAEDAEHLQQVLIQMCRVVFVCSSDIQVQRFI